MAKKKTKIERQAKNRLSDVVVDEVSLVDRPAVPQSVYVIAKRDVPPTEPKDENMTVEKTATPAETPAETVAKTEAPAAPVAATPAEVKVEKTEDASEKLQKAKQDVAAAFMAAADTLRGVASIMDASGLYRLAELLSYITYQFHDLNEVKEYLAKRCDEAEPKTDAEKELIEKATRVLAPSQFAVLSEVQKSLVESGEKLDKIAKSAKRITKSGDEAATEESPAGTPATVQKSETEAPATIVPEVSFLDQLEEALAKQAAEQQTDSDAKLLESLAKATEGLSSTVTTLLSKSDALDGRLSKALGTAG